MSLPLRRSQRATNRSGEGRARCHGAWLRSRGRRDVAARHPGWIGRGDAGRRRDQIFTLHAAGGGATGQCGRLASVPHLRTARGAGAAALPAQVPTHDDARTRTAGPAVFDDPHATAGAGAYGAASARTVVAAHTPTALPAQPL